MTGLGTGQREGELGGQRGRQPSGFWRGPPLGGGADVRVEPVGTPPQACRVQHQTRPEPLTQAPGPAFGLGLLSPE